MTTTTLISQACDHCGAPLDDQQRYCIACGASRHHVDDPLARFMTRRRVVRTVERAPVAVTSRRPERLWIALAFALVPVAAAAGALVARGNRDDNSAVLAALRAQKAPVVQVGAGGGAATADAAGTTPPSKAKATTLTSSFHRQKGFVVALQTVGDGKGVAAAERSARAKHAPHVGLIVAGDFRLTPKATGYVVYSGEYGTRAKAAAALAKLKRRFPKAKVVAVAPSRAVSTKSGNVSFARHATAQQKAVGRKTVQDIQSRKGKSYVDQQRKLPDTIVVP